MTTIMIIPQGEIHPATKPGYNDDRTVGIQELADTIDYSSDRAFTQFKDTILYYAGRDSMSEDFISTVQASESFDEFIEDGDVFNKTFDVTLKDNDYTDVELNKLLGVALRGSSGYSDVNNYAIKDVNRFKTYPEYYEYILLDEKGSQIFGEDTSFDYYKTTIQPIIKYNGYFVAVLSSMNVRDTITKEKLIPFVNYVYNYSIVNPSNSAGVDVENSLRGYLSNSDNSDKESFTKKAYEYSTTGYYLPSKKFKGVNVTDKYAICTTSFSTNKALTSSNMHDSITWYIDNSAIHPYKTFAPYYTTATSGKYITQIVTLGRIKSDMYNEQGIEDEIIGKTNVSDYDTMDGNYYILDNAVTNKKYYNWLTKYGYEIP